MRANQVVQILAVFAFASPAAVSANCLGWGGTCYSVIGAASAANFGVYQGSFTYYNAETSGYLDRSYNANRAISDVSLAEGAIRLLAIGGNAGSSGQANGQFSDTVRFSLPDGIESVSLPISFRIDGTNTPYSTPSYNAGIVFQMASYKIAGSNASHYDVSSISRNCGVQLAFTQAVCQSGPAYYEFSDTITVWEDVIYRIQLGFSITASSASRDFLNTAQFRWQLPNDVTFESGSGVFLSSAVPEPAQWVMMVVGFGLVGGVARQQPRRQIAIY